MTKPLEAYIAELQEVINGPHGKLWYHTPAVSALIAALEQSQEDKATQREYYEQVISDGSKRIAELESSQLAVELPPKFNVQMSGDKVTRALFSGHNGAIDDCAEVLRAAGITVQGDE